MLRISLFLLALCLLGTGCTVAEVIVAEESELNVARTQANEARLLDVAREGTHVAHVSVEHRLVAHGGLEAQPRLQGWSASSMFAISSGFLSVRNRRLTRSR